MPKSNSLIVDTAQGQVRGLLVDSECQIRRFSGLRYAASPTGTLRWRPPQPAPTRTEIIDATTFGNACYQDYSYDDFVWRRGEFPRSEDCLFLNLWTGAKCAQEKLPVMVWFHGGGYTGGYGHAKIFDGTELAKRGVVIVTINYRLGPFGFFAHPGLAHESDTGSAGNYGLMDKVTALQWVQDNIGGFGGDADNVTIFGQSAGSISVCALMVAHAARGLFHKAIGQSAACVNPPRNPNADPKGFTQGLQLANAAGLSRAGLDTIEGLRELSAAQLQALGNSSGWAAQEQVVVDGYFLTEPPRQSYERGAHYAVPLLVGSLSNEGHLLFDLEEGLTVDILKARLARQFGRHSDQLLALYANALAQSPALAQREIATDLFMAWGMRTWAKYNRAAGAPCYLYFMSRATPIFALYTPDDPVIEVPAGPRSAGAYHSGDLAYVFGNTRQLGLNWEAADHCLSEQMVGYWTNFARYGTPNGEGLPHWPEFDDANHTLIFDAEIRAEPGVRSAKLDTFDAVFGEQPL